MRTSEFSMPVPVEFPTQVTARPVNVTVLAPVRVLAAVASQSVTIDEAAVDVTLTLELFTEVQNPFELRAVVESTDVLPTGVTLETAMSGTEDEAVWQDDEYTDGSADCSNTWRWQLQYSTPGQRSAAITGFSDAWNWKRQSLGSAHEQRCRPATSASRNAP